MLFLRVDTSKCISFDVGTSHHQPFTSALIPLNTTPSNHIHSLNQSDANTPKYINTHIYTLQPPFPLSIYLSISQLPMHHPLPPTQIRHRHNLHHQTRPTGKMLRSLPSARFGVILLPRKARSFPLIEDVFDEVDAKGGVDIGGLGFVGAGLDCDVLDR